MQDDDVRAELNRLVQHARLLVEISRELQDQAAEITRRVRELADRSHGERSEA